MQAITIAIGKTGIGFFTQHYLQSAIQKLLQTLTPPDRDIPIPDFSYSSGINSTTKVSQLTVRLRQGSLSGFVPSFQQVTQGLSGTTPVFSLIFGSSAFSAKYKWNEAYHWASESLVNGPDGPVWVDNDGNENNSYDYSPSFTQLVATIEVTFLFDKQANAWEIKVQETSGVAQGAHANVPSDSVLTYQNQSCSGHHISEATAQAVQAIDFATTINTLISGILATIPGSGDLGNGIAYDFSLGDSGLAFPNNDGIQMGVKGGASYKGTPFSGDKPPSLPLPAPLADNDTHHLNMYVSNYEVDALHWAYYQAGVLNLVINPTDLSDPSVLNVSDYTALESALDPYSAFVMQAQITQNAAPVTAFQTVYLFTKTGMDTLKAQLPADVYQRVQKLSSNPFISLADLEAFLTSANVPSTWFKLIEQVGITMAMVVSQNMTFTLLIQNGEPTQPYIKFQVQRQDVLINLKLGPADAQAPCIPKGNLPPISKSAQCLQYGFANASNTCTYLDSSIKGFNGPIFAELVWPVVAEKNYADTLSCLGQIGVPLPIMQGFQFDFTNAQLSIQQGYVSILANVEFKNKTAIPFNL